MTLPRQKFREIVFQILFCVDVAEGYNEEMVPFLMKHLKTTKKSVLSALEKALAVFEKKDEYEILLEKAATGYASHRISRVEKNILRLSLYEFFLEENFPANIMIAEGIRLCKKFGSPEGAKFVHALLDAIVKKDVAHSKE